MHISAQSFTYQKNQTSHGSNTIVAVFHISLINLKQKVPLSRCSHPLHYLVLYLDFTIYHATAYKSVLCKVLWLQDCSLLRILENEVTLIKIESTVIRTFLCKDQVNSDIFCCKSEFCLLFMTTWWSDEINMEITLTYASRYKYQNYNSLLLIKTMLFLFSTILLSCNYWSSLLCLVAFYLLKCTPHFILHLRICFCKYWRG